MGKGREIYLLVEAAPCFALVHVKGFEEVGIQLETSDDALADANRFAQVASLKAVHRFRTAEEALENCKAITNSESTELLRNFLSQHLPQKKSVQLAVVDPGLGKELAQHGFSIYYNKNVLEVAKYCRFHFSHLVKDVSERDMFKFQIGLGHSMARSLISSDPKRQDKHTLHCIALIDMLDKSINQFAMRAKEWYSWHFPELQKIVPDTVKFLQLASLIGIKENFDFDGRKDELAAILDNDEDLAEEVVSASQMSMGTDMSEADLSNIRTFAAQLLHLTQQRVALGDYLHSKLDSLAPSLQALLGDVLAARLIAHAGSLTNLAKYPASTIQILGAEKALFRALKTKSKTPKFGLLFQSSFIGRAGAKDKGRISRFLANKASIAARIDRFSAFPNPIFGEKFRDQVEDKLKVLVEGGVPRKNLDVVMEAMAEYEERVAEAVRKEKKEKKRKRKREADEHDDEGEDDAANKTDDGDGERHRKKKKKKRKETDVEQFVVVSEGGEKEEEVKKNKKSKKSSKDKHQSEAEATDWEENNGGDDKLVQEKKKKKKRKEKVQ